MPLNNYTVGRDVQVDINTAYGVVTVPVVISFDAKPKVNQVDVTKITGETDTLMIPKTGKEPSIQKGRMTRWIRGGRFGSRTILLASTARQGTITETITENNGAVTVWRYTSVQFNFTDPWQEAG